MLTSHCLHTGSSLYPLYLYFSTLIPPQSTLILPISHLDSFPEYLTKSLEPSQNLLPQHPTLPHTHLAGSEPLSLKSVLESFSPWVSPSPCGWGSPVAAQGSWRDAHVPQWVTGTPSLVIIPNDNSNIVHTCKFIWFSYRLLSPVRPHPFQEEETRSFQ